MDIFGRDVRAAGADDHLDIRLVPLLVNFLFLSK